jgi:hypothetical protein
LLGQLSAGLYSGCPPFRPRQLEICSFWAGAVLLLHAAQCCAPGAPRPDRANLFARQSEYGWKDTTRRKGVSWYDRASFGGRSVLPHDARVAVATIFLAQNCSGCGRSGRRCRRMGHASRAKSGRRRIFEPGCALCDHGTRDSR